MEYILNNLQDIVNDYGIQNVINDRENVVTKPLNTEIFYVKSECLVKETKPDALKENAQKYLFELRVSIFFNI